MPDWPWVIAAYTLTWAVLGVYALRIHRRLVRARDELDAVRDHPTGSTEVES